jgi:hypothetical protein
VSKLIPAARLARCLPVLLLALACAQGAPDDGDAGRGPITSLPVLDPEDLPDDHDPTWPPPPDAGPAADAGGSPPPTGDAGSTPSDAGATAPDAGGPDVPTVLTSDEGGPCFPAGGAVCSGDLICVALYDSGAGTCARGCDAEGSACAGGGSCVDMGTLEAPALACAEEVASGEGCDPESLVLCAGDAVCFASSADPLGGLCRTRCHCDAGDSCVDAACAPETCVVTDASSGDGFCGSAAGPFEACSPVRDGVWCAGDAVCFLDELGDGECWPRCTTSGDSDPVCDATGQPSACFGDDESGRFCQRTSDLGQGELCTDGSTSPAIPLSCASGFGCLAVSDTLPAGLGLCLEDCSGGGASDCETGDCYNVEPLVAGAGARCLTELPSGTRGCSTDAPEPRCGGESPVCVTLSGDETICKTSCVIADCPSGACTCGAGQACAGSFLASDTTGVCGEEVAVGASCDEDADVYCAPAPGEDDDTKAFSACLADSCHWVCAFPDGAGGTESLTCPSGYTCRTDPTGRLNDSVSVCVADG